MDPSKQSPMAGGLQRRFGVSDPLPLFSENQPFAGHSYPFRHPISHIERAPPGNPETAWFNTVPGASQQRTWPQSQLQHPVTYHKEMPEQLHLASEVRQEAHVHSLMGFGEQNVKKSGGNETQEGRREPVTDQHKIVNPYTSPSGHCVAEPISSVLSISDSGGTTGIAPAKQAAARPIMPWETSFDSSIVFGNTSPQRIRPGSVSPTPGLPTIHEHKLFDRPAITGRQSVSRHLPGSWPKNEDRVQDHAGVAVVPTGAKKGGKLPRLVIPAHSTTTESIANAQKCVAAPGFYVPAGFEGVHGSQLSNPSVCGSSPPTILPSVAAPTTTSPPPREPSRLDRASTPTPPSPTTSPFSFLLPVTPTPFSTPNGLQNFFPTHRSAPGVDGYELRLHEAMQVYERRNALEEEAGGLDREGEVGSRDGGEDGDGDDEEEPHEQCKWWKRIFCTKCWALRRAKREQPPRTPTPSSRDSSPEKSDLPGTRDTQSPSSKSENTQSPTTTLRRSTALRGRGTRRRVSSAVSQSNSQDVPRSISNTFPSTSPPSPFPPPTPTHTEHELQQRKWWHRILPHRQEASNKLVKKSKRGGNGHSDLNLNTEISLFAGGVGNTGQWSGWVGPMQRREVGSV